MHHQLQTHTGIRRDTLLSDRGIAGEISNQKRTVHNKTGVPGKYLWTTKMGAAVEWGEVARATGENQRTSEVVDYHLQWCLELARNWLLRVDCVHFHFWVQWPHTGSMRQVMVGVFTPQKLTNARKEGSPLPYSQLLNICQHKLIFYTDSS